MPEPTPDVPRLFELWLDASDGSCRTAWGVVWPDGTASLRNANFPSHPAITRQTLDALLDTCGIDRKLQRVEWMPNPDQPAEHCIHDPRMHQRHHRIPVIGCPWCSETGADTPRP